MRWVCVLITSKGNLRGAVIGLKIAIFSHFQQLPLGCKLIQVSLQELNCSPEFTSVLNSKLQLYI